MLRLDTQTRETVRKLEAEKRSALAPAKKQAAAERKADRKARSKAHVNTPGQRAPRELDAGYLAFLRRLPCIASVMGVPGCEGATQAAHLRFSDAAKGRINPGMGNKPHDRHANPLCAHHHIRDQHAREEQAFWNDMGVDPGDLSGALYAAYLAGEDGLAVLRRFTPSQRRSA